jgi:DNA-binding HxlR family transcriptional regulator
MNDDRDDASTPDRTDRCSSDADQSARQWLTDEPRYSIVMTVLGHPERLPSLTELDYYVDADRSAIRDALDALVKRGFLSRCEFTGNLRNPDDPTVFWGPTESGIRRFRAWGYLQYVPFVEELQEATVRTERVRQHRRARRPPLPEAVLAAFAHPVDEVDHPPDGLEPDDCETVEAATRDAEVAEVDAQRLLREATDESQAPLVADIVGHPQGLPSVEELTYMSPALNERAVRDRLDALYEAGVIRRVELDASMPGYPSTFYGLTEEARAVFDEWGLFPREPWQRQYRRVVKPARIRALETMSRPDS